MLKHIVEVNHDRSQGMVVIEYTITDGTRASHAQECISELVPYFQIVRLCKDYTAVRILDQGFYMAVCKQLKRKAQDHFHGEVTTEIRMNER